MNKPRKTKGKKKDTHTATHEETDNEHLQQHLDDLFNAVWSEDNRQRRLITHLIVAQRKPKASAPTPKRKRNPW